MTPATTTIEPPDQLDPWGFGVTAADRSAFIEWREPLDEPVDDDDVLDFGNVDTAIDATFKANGGAGNDVIQDVDALALVAFPTLENFEEISVFP